MGTAQDNLMERIRRVSGQAAAVGSARMAAGAQRTLAEQYGLTGATAGGRRYNYRTSRSDVGSPRSPRRYPSQTLLDGVRPGPSATYNTPIMK